MKQKLGDSASGGVELHKQYTDMGSLFQTLIVL